MELLHILYDKFLINRYKNRLDDKIGSLLEEN